MRPMPGFAKKVAKARPNVRAFSDSVNLNAVPLNCAFEGTNLYVADFGQADTTGEALMVGRLLKVDVGVRGMPLFAGKIS